MKEIVSFLAMVNLVACASPGKRSSVMASVSPEAVCGVSAVAFDKMSFELRDEVRNADEAALANDVYTFSLKTVGTLNSTLAKELKDASGALQINEIAGSIGTGRGSLCSIVKLVASNKVSVVESAQKLLPAANSPEAVCGVAAVAYDKVSVTIDGVSGGFKGMVSNADKAALTNDIYGFAMISVGTFDSALAKELKVASGARDIDALGESSGVGHGSLCSVIKLVASDKVKALEIVQKITVD